MQMDSANVDIPSNWNSWLSRLYLPFLYKAYCYLVLSSLLILYVAMESVGILQGMFWAARNWFCSSKPLQYIGWSYSKVVIPVADFTLRFFPFCFSLWFAVKKKSRQIPSDLSASGWEVFPLHRCIIDFTEGVDCLHRAKPPRTDMEHQRSLHHYHFPTTQAQPKHDPSFRPSCAQAPTKYRPSTDQVQIIIQSMTEDYMALKDIMAKMGIKHRPTFRENYLNPALEEGAIERLYPEQPKHPKQKYRLTEAAKEWKNKKIPKQWYPYNSIGYNSKMM